MSIDIDDGEDGWMLTCNNQFIVASSCHHVVKKYAEALSRARDATHRKAMQIMTEELGMCEEYAKHLYLHMQGGAGELRAN